jgi:hypothetical protein
MSAALWLLLRLQLVGWLRSLGSGMKTVRGVILLLVGLAVFVPWVAVVFLGGSEGRMYAGDVATFGPVLLLVYCLTNVLFSPNERAVYFSPAEVQFLFAGPFTRREVLIYKIILSLLVSVPTALLLGAVLRFRDGWLPAVLLGLLLISIFLQLFTLTLGLLASAVGAGLYSRARKITGVVLTVLTGLAVLEAGRQSGWDWRGLGERIINTTAWEVASYPLKVFFDLLLARTWGELWLPLLIGVGVNLALVAAILALDHGYQEASAASSERRYAAIQRLRGKSVGAEAPTERRSRWTLPTFPHLGGIGPILWRQLTTAFRVLGRLMLAVAVIATALAFWLAGNFARESPGAVLGAVIGLVAWLSVFITTLVPFDYRGDLDRIALLKTLPIAPWRLTVGQLLTPVILLTAGQWLALGLLGVMAPGEWPLILACAACVPLFNFVLIGLDNLLFLLFPVRLMAATPGDFQALGRNVLLSMGKLMGLGTIVMLSAMAAVPVGLLTRSIAWGLLAACPVLLVCGVALVPVVSLAFRRFDVGRDTPA